MIISNVYYDGYEISHIYINGKLAWRKIVILPIYYDIHLSTNLEEDAALLAIEIQQIMSGDFICTVGDKYDSYISSINIVVGEHDNTVALVDNEKHSYSVSLPSVVGNINDNINVKLHEINTALATDVVILRHSYNQEVLQTHRATAISADARIGNYKHNHNIDIVHQANSLGAEAKIGDYQNHHNVDITHQATSVGAKAIIGDSRSDLHVTMTHQATSVSADARIGDYQSHIDVAVEHQANSLGVEAICGIHEHDLKAYETNESSISMANVQSGSKNSYLIFEQDCDGSCGAMSALTIDKQSVIMPVYDMDADAKSMQIVLLNKSKMINVHDTVDGTFESLNLLNLNSNAITDIIDELDGSGDSLPIVSSAHDGGGIFEDKLFNLSNAQIVSIAYDATCACESTIDASLSNCADYIYPVQTGTNLYIPQFYITIQSGTHLDFRNNNMIN